VLSIVEMSVTFLSFPLEILRVA